MALQIRKGNPNKPPRVLIYGEAGVGKSTLGARSERPIFISPEGGNDQLETKSGASVDEIMGVDSWKALVANIELLRTSKHDFKTAVFDSADWIEKLCHAAIIGNTGKSIITVDGGYGAGYRKSEAMHRELIENISRLREERGMAIIVTAHADVRQVKDPSMPEDYDHFEIKCHQMVSSLWREWVDALFFARFQTHVKAAEDTDRARAFGNGKRIIYATNQPSFQAKNRYGLDPNGSGYEFTTDFWDFFVNHIKKKTAAELNSLDLDAIRLGISDMAVLIKDPGVADTIAKTIKEAEERKDEATLRAVYARMKELTKGKN